MLTFLLLDDNCLLLDCSSSCSLCVFINPCALAIAASLREGRKRIEF